MKKCIAIILALGLYGITQAQNILDVVHMNNPVQLGTPRFAATSGAFTALGNDFSGIHVNPAGLAVFRHDELGISMGYGGRTTSSVYYGIEQNGDNSGFIFSNVGFVKKFQTKDPNVTWNFGLTFNRNADFSSKSTNLGVNPVSSILEQWMTNATGVAGADLFDNGYIYEALAWETYLIDDDADQNYSTQAVIDQTEQFWEEEITGRFDELGISFAVDDNNKWYYGLSINVPFYRYDSRYYYTESGFQGDSIRGLEWFEEFTNRGVGVNAKLGVIYRPINSFRVGLSIWTPSWLFVDQTYYTEVLAKFRSAQDYSAAFDPNGSFSYVVQTAPQANIGAAWVFNKSGFLSVDYAFIATPWSRTGTDGLDYLNDDINSSLQYQHNIRFGAEVRLVNFFIRGGYSWLSNPFTTPLQSSNRSSYSIGGGYRTNKITIDLSFGIQNQDFNYYPYSEDLTEPARQTITQRPFLASISFRL